MMAKIDLSQLQQQQHRRQKQKKTLNEYLVAYNVLV